MGALDDLEAALAAEPLRTLRRLEVSNFMAEHGDQVLAVCRAAVAYREAFNAGAESKKSIDAHGKAIIDLLAATEGL